MENDSRQIVELPGGSAKDALTKVLREGARKLLKAAVEAEVEEWIEERRTIMDETGKQMVVRNGHMPQRSVLTGLGEIPVRKPRVRDRREKGEREMEIVERISPFTQSHFRSSIQGWNHVERGRRLIMPYTTFDNNSQLQGKAVLFADRESRHSLPFISNTVFTYDFLSG